MTRPPDEIAALHPLLPLAWTAATQAGRFLADERPEDLIVESKSTPVDAVTEMDRGAEQRIIDVLMGARPADGILGEEGGERLGTSGIRWVVDPLDGTVNYLYRFPDWGVSVAAEEGGVAIVGVIDAPMLDETYVGIRGHGAWSVQDGRAARLWAGSCPDLAQALIGTGFGYSAERRAWQGDVLRGLLPQVRDIRRRGAATIDLVSLARGQLDGFYEFGLNPWDYAVGALIAQEAGIRVGSLMDDDFSVGTFVAAVPSVFDALRAAVRAVS